MEYSTISLLAALSILAVYQAGVEGCSELEPRARSPFHNETDDQKVYYSEYVLFGRAGRERKGPKFPYSDRSGVRTIEFNVICIYKQNASKALVPRLIYVAGVGNKKGQVEGCPPAPLKQGKAAAMYLRKLEPSDTVMENTFEIEYAPVTEPANDEGQIVDDMTLSCNLNLEYPEGVEDMMCMDALEEPYCTSHTPPSTPAPEMTTAKKVEVTTKKMKEPKTTPAKGGDGNKPGTKIENEEDDTYNTENQEQSKDPSGDAAIKTLSKSLAVLISVIFIII